MHTELKRLPNPMRYYISGFMALPVSIQFFLSCGVIEIACIAIYEFTDSRFFVGGVVVNFVFAYCSFFWVLYDIFSKRNLINGEEN